MMDMAQPKTSKNPLLCSFMYDGGDLENRKKKRKFTRDYEKSSS